MVNREDKVSERDSIDKKRKRSSIETVNPKQHKDDVYTTVVNYEEEEAKNRTLEDDAALFRKTCEHFRKLVGSIADLKKSTTEKAKGEIIENRIDGSFMLIMLKKLNRLDKIRLRSNRDALHKEKIRVDSSRLQLQNLLYEADHLEKEVEKCYRFKSQDEEIELVSEEEFYNAAPETVSRPDLTKNDEHAKRLARLEYELQQRKELSALCKDLQAEKQKVAQDIDSKSDRLNSLLPQLENILKATRPLQESLNMQLEKEWDIPRLAGLLPRPLYLAFVNFSAFGEACDKLLTVSIIGDEELAKTLDDDSDKESDAPAPDGKNDSDIEDLDLDMETERSPKKKKNRRKGEKSNSLKDEKKRRIEKLFQVHPLNVQLQIKTKGTDAEFTINFYYLITLDIVSVTCTINNVNNTTAAAHEVISPFTVFDSIISDDNGIESPNAKTYFQLNKLDLSPAKLISYFDDRKLGKPYRWAQDVCGVQYMKLNPHGASSSTTCYSKISHELSLETIPSTIKLLRNRISSRLSLHAQICVLESKNFDLSVSTGSATPLRLSNSLVQLSSITWEDYVASNATKLFIDENYVDSNNLLYRAVITRDSAKLECFISISPNFPKELPLWALALSWNGKQLASNNASIRDMEFWINSFDVKVNKTDVLKKQLQRCMTSFDIYLETDCFSTNHTEFPVDKTFLRAFRGRNRGRPYKIMKTGGGIVFTQIN